LPAGRGFGEIMLWAGVAVIASPALQGWQWVTLASPAFVALLFTRISGVPMLEKKADETPHHWPKCWPQSMRRSSQTPGPRQAPGFSPTGQNVRQKECCSSLFAEQFARFTV